jgi:hypothetical protein
VRGLLSYNGSGGASLSYVGIGINKYYYIILILSIENKKASALDSQFYFLFSIF